MAMRAITLVGLDVHARQRQTSADQTTHRPEVEGLRPPPAMTTQTLVALVRGLD